MKKTYRYRMEYIESVNTINLTGTLKAKNFGEALKILSKRFKKTSENRRKLTIER